MDRARVVADLIEVRLQQANDLQAPEVPQVRIPKDSIA